MYVGTIGYTHRTKVPASLSSFGYYLLQCINRYSFANIPDCEIADWTSSGQVSHVMGCRTCYQRLSLPMGLSFLYRFFGLGVEK